LSHRPQLTTEAGAPVADNQHSQTAGATGPVLLQDHHLLEKLARFNRERIPERVVHAVGSGAYGTFEVTNPDIARYTRMKVFSHPGKRTEVFLRFSTVAGSKGAPDTARDPRGFAVRFYTEDGNWDVVGNNTPVFFLRDGIKFPDFIHSQKYDPYTNCQEPDNQWDFFSYSPEATHQFTWLFGDRGIPATLRHTDGFGSHTFQWVNAKNERFWVKLHFKTNQGIKTLTSEEQNVLRDGFAGFVQKGGHALEDVIGQAKGVLLKNSAQRAGRLPRILYVEDNPQNRDIVRRYLGGLFEVLEAEDGEHGVERATREAPDLILMDLSLPRIDGWEATRRLRQLPAAATIPVIAVTAHAGREYQDKATAAGCTAYLTKPLDRDQLLDTIRKHLGRSHG